MTEITPENARKRDALSGDIPIGQQFSWQDEPQRVAHLMQHIEEAYAAGRRFYAERTRSVLSVYFVVESGWGQDFLLRSDTHHDSVHCNRTLEEKHLKMATDRDALILDDGDLFDAMQGRYDPRRAYTDIRPEYLIDNKYYDNLVDDAESFYAPYAPRWLLMARGNHEMSVIKNAGTDLTDRLVDRLNNKHGGYVTSGKYGGWVRLVFLRAKRFMTTVKIRYYHGSGGEAPVTRGVLQTNRQAVVMADADIVWNGHNHHSYIVPIKRQRLSQRGEIYYDLQWHLRTPGYKDDFGEGSEGWEVERGGVPKPQGAIFLSTRYFDHKIEVTAVQEVE